MPIIALLINLVILGVALVSGFLLLGLIAVVIAGVVGYVVLRHKLTGRSAMPEYYEKPEADSQVIEAEYQVIDSDSDKK